VFSQKITKRIENDNFSIKWVAQFPDENTEKPKTSLKDWIVNLILGENEPFSLKKPFSIVAINPDSIIITDQEAGSIVRVNNKVGEILQIKDRSGIQFLSLVGMSAISNERIIVTDSYLNKIFTVSFTDKKLQILNDSLKLNQPTGISYNEKSKEIWVVETAAHRVLVLDSKGRLLKTIGERGNEPGKFNFPTFIWIDKIGNVYIVDSMNYRIQIFNSEGEFITAFGEIGDSSGYFARPKGIATDSYGHIYIVDGLFHAVQIFNKSGEYLYSFGSQGREQGKFWLPTGIFIDSKNFIYIADSYNSRIQIFQLAKGGGSDE
jgi:DNA-binding beta-propeller fold protein YncE